MGRKTQNQNTGGNAMYYPINENTARLSHQMMSMSDYKEGSATAGYRAAVDE